MRNAVLAEFLGTGFLLVSVVGSGIMAETLAGGNIALALLANAIATGCMLYCIITLFGAVSGAHFNPIVSLAFVLRGEMPITRACAFMSAQIFGAITGVILTHAMFDQSLVSTVANPAEWWAALGVRNFCKFRAAADRFRRFGTKLQSYCHNGRALYHRSILVHRLHQLCQPCGLHRAGAVRYLCRH